MIIIKSEHLQNVLSNVKCFVWYVGSRRSKNFSAICGKRTLLYIDIDEYIFMDINMDIDIDVDMDMDIDIDKIWSDIDTGTGI